MIILAFINRAAKQRQKQTPKLSDIMCQSMMTKRQS